MGLNIFVSWRLLGTDSDDLGFNIYRSIDNAIVKLNKKPIADRTCFQDTGVNLDHAISYYVKPVLNEK